jgi:hypothetical protein
MSKTNRAAPEIAETESEVNDELEPVDEEDYAFIIGPDGELKNLFVPDGFDIDPPPKVKKILKIFGINDINSAWSDETLH